MSSDPIDNVPLIPDKVVDKIRKGQDVALEEISPAAAEMRDTREAKRSTPIHAESLTPITKERAAQFTKFDGQRLPSAPGTRRVIPAPYRRDRVVASAHGGHGKSWQYCRADQVVVGDIVPDLGLVMDVRAVVRHVPRWELIGADPTVSGGLAPGPEDLVAVGTDAVLTGHGAKVVVLDAGTQVRVFRRSESETGTA